MDLHTAPAAAGAASFHESSDSVLPFLRTAALVVNTGVNGGKTPNTGTKGPSSLSAGTSCPRKVVAEA